MGGEREIGREEEREREERERAGRERRESGWRGEIKGNIEGAVEMEGW